MYVVMILDAPFFFLPFCNCASRYSLFYCCDWITRWLRFRYVLDQAYSGFPGEMLRNIRFNLDVAWRRLSDWVCWSSRFFLFDFYLIFFVVIDAIFKGWSGYPLWPLLIFFFLTPCCCCFLPLFMHLSHLSRFLVAPVFTVFNCFLFSLLSVEYPVLSSLSLLFDSVSS